MYTLKYSLVNNEISVTILDNEVFADLIYENSKIFLLKIRRECRKQDLIIVLEILKLKLKIKEFMIENLYKCKLTYYYLCKSYRDKFAVHHGQKYQILVFYLSRRGQKNL